MSKTGRRIAPDEAFVAYLTFGPSRSLVKLRKHYEADPGVKTPAIATLKSWSTQHAWMARAREHDSKAAARAHELAVAEQGLAHWDAAQALYKTAELSLDRLQAVLPQVPVSADSAKALKDIAIDSIKAAEVLSGGVSDRTDSGKAQDDAADPAEFLERIERTLKGKGPTRH